MPNRKIKVSPVTLLVFEFLCKEDDLFTVSQIAEATGCSRNNIMSALGALYNYKAVDVVTSKPPFWFATPQTDTRMKFLKERTPETKPRRVRKPKPTKE